MAPKQQIVITGVGVVSPIGIGREAMAASLSHGRSGIRRLDMVVDDALPAPVGGEVVGFDPKSYVRPRKSLKVMSRDIQLAFAAADLACLDARLRSTPVDPDRLGIVFGAEMILCELAELTAVFRGCIVEGRFDFSRWGEQAMGEIFPLWLLKYLPNMPACHVGIAQDARGPNNSLTLGEVSSLSAVAEAVRVIERGHADVMIAGGVSSRMHPAVWALGNVLEFSRWRDDPAAAMRPFDAQRDGTVIGEGAGAVILEPLRHAQARGAPILARVLGYAATFEPCQNGRLLQGSAIRRAILGALLDAGLTPGDLGHVAAHGTATLHDDRIEAQAIRATLGDVPVTAPKSYFGNLGAGSGSLELVVSLLALQSGLVPPTLNYRHPDPQCPVNVVHGQPLQAAQPTALVLSHARQGQAIAVIVGGP